MFKKSRIDDLARGLTIANNDLSLAARRRDTARRDLNRAEEEVRNIEETKERVLEQLKRCGAEGE